LPDRKRDAAPEVLAANQRFYRAFVERDLPAMEALWAVDAPVACIHPGWNALRRRDQVIASWRSILGNDESPEVTCANATAHVLGADAAFVICEEQVADSVLIATNVFVLERGDWRLVHHQAAPMASEPIEVASPRDRGQDRGEDGQTLN